MIKVKNIYHMLAYAFKVLNGRDYAWLAAEEFDYASDLLAAILAKGVSNQVRRALGREYVETTENLRTPAGKIEVSYSIKQLSLMRRQLVCSFDTFTENTHMNQVLKATLTLLLRSPEVSLRQKKSIKRVMMFFGNVSDISPRHIVWSNMKYDRNSATYRMLIEICYLVIAGMLLAEEAGQHRLANFIDDKRMYSLYERFIRAYYQRHYPHMRVSAPHVAWHTDDGVVDFLPTMETDVTIEYGGKTLIIDAKYYSKSMQYHGQYESVKVHSSNLYQLFTYVKNKSSTAVGSVGGALLYARTDEEITPDFDYSLSGHRISVKSLDLNQDFALIQGQLHAVIVSFFGVDVEKQPRPLSG